MREHLGKMYEVHTETVSSAPKNPFAYHSHHCQHNDTHTSTRRLNTTHVHTHTRFSIRPCSNGKSAATYPTVITALHLGRFIFWHLLFCCDSRFMPPPRSTRMQGKTLSISPSTCSLAQKGAMQKYLC